LKHRAIFKHRFGTQIQSVSELEVVGEPAAVKLKAVPKATAVQTLRAFKHLENCAKRLNCGAFTATVKLQGTDYYRWVFANEPEWQEFQ